MLVEVISERKSLRGRMVYPGRRGRISSITSSVCSGRVHVRERWKPCHAHPLILQSGQRNEQPRAFSVLHDSRDVPRMIQQIVGVTDL